MNTHIYARGTFRVRKSYAADHQTVLEINDGYSMVLFWFPNEDAVRGLSYKLLEYLALQDKAKEEAP